MVTEKRELKPEQAAAAHTLDKHVSVTAGPGSGKTTVLVERYLHILRESKNIGIDQIVAITFTHRAANEMRERLRKELDRILRECSPRERPRWMRYKRTLDGAIISTIHGFCSRLLREFPVEAQIDPQFLSLDNHDAAILLEAAVEETLTELISKERELTSQLAVGFGRGKLAEALGQIYTSVRGQGLNLETLAERTKASHSTAETHQQALKDLTATMRAFFELPSLSPGAEAKRRHAQAQWPSLRQLLEADRPSLAEYCTQIERFRAEARPSKVGAATKIVDLLDELLWGVKKEPPLGLVPQLCFDLFARDYALEIIHILTEVERRYREKKQNLTALDFEDLQLRALELLEHPAVLLRATQRYRFFLVDEFQDTNGVQRELMHKLALHPAASRANLFIVGDRKQSIYGFRGADVDVFQQTTNALKDAGGIEQPLNLNFRSQPPLIRFFNTLFKTLFQRMDGLTAEEAAELGFVEFEESVGQREEEHPAPLVELLIDTKSPPDPESGADEDSKAHRTQAERDAKQVAQRIIALALPDNSAASGGTTGTFEYKDIALLFRTTTDVHSYESALRAANIPFQTVQGKGFYEREEISDLIQLLRFLDNKTDELALAAVLRSPLGGISDNALLALRCAPKLAEVAQENSGRHFNQPRRLLYAVRHHHGIAYLESRDHEQLERVGNLLQKLIERRNHYPIADLLRFAVDESEYLTIVAANFDGAQRLANVHKLFTLAERFERAGAHLVRDFVRYVQEFETIGSREAEGQIDDSANAVRLMTIHQAKGLEFPVVFIPNLHHRSMRPQEHWFALDRHRGLTVKVPDGRNNRVAGCTLEKFRERAKQREYAESIRVLYVGATRAEDRLFLSGATDELAKLGGAQDNWLKLIWQKLDLNVSQSGLVDLGEGAQLAVTLNLTDEPLPPVSSGDVIAEQPEVAGSLRTAFPLLQPITGQLQTGNDRFSVTQLINYRRCPRQYYFDRVLHVPSADEVAVWNDAEAPEPPANMTATLKGAVIHRFCETYTAGEDHETRLRQSFAEVISSRRAQLADRLVDINRDEAIKELWPLAQNYLASNAFQRIEHARQMGSDGSRFPEGKPGLWSELGFRLRRPGGFITGTIDKLLVSRTAGEEPVEIEIIDFKTNRLSLNSSPVVEAAQTSVPDQPEKRVRSRSRATRRMPDHDASQFAFDFSASGATGAAVQWTSEQADVSTPIADQVRLVALDYQLQMQAYALAIRQLLPELAETARIRATLHFLHPDVEYSLPAELLEPEVCSQALDNAMVQIISSTEPDEFPALAASHCRICNFLDACTVGRNWLRNRAG